MIFLQLVAAFLLYQKEFLFPRFIALSFTEPPDYPGVLLIQSSLREKPEGFFNYLTKFIIDILSSYIVGDGALDVPINYILNYLTKFIILA